MNKEKFLSENSPRKGWDRAFQAASAGMTDELLLESLWPNQFDTEEWGW